MIDNLSRNNMKLCPRICRVRYMYIVRYIQPEN